MFFFVLKQKKNLWPNLKKKQNKIKKKLVGEIFLEKNFLSAKNFFFFKFFLSGNFFFVMVDC